MSWQQRYEFIREKIFSSLPVGERRGRSAMARWLRRPLSTVQRWDEGQRPSPADTAMLCAKLELNPEWVLLGVGNAKWDGFVPFLDEYQDWVKKVLAIEEIAKAVFDAAGLKYSRNALEKALGFSKERLKGWEHGRHPKSDDLEALANYLGLSAAWLLFGVGEPCAGAPQLVAPVRNDFLPKSGKSAKVLAFTPAVVSGPFLPVFGLAKCGTHGWESKRTMAIGVERLPGLSDQAFAVLPVGDSMEPEGIREGYVCYCDPERKPELKDAVYIQDKSGNATLKLFMGPTPESEGWYRLRGWLPQKAEAKGQSPFNLDIEIDYIDVMAPVVFVKRRL